MRAGRKRISRDLGGSWPGDMQLQPTPDRPRTSYTQNHILCAGLGRCGSGLFVLQFPKFMLPPFLPHSGFMPLGSLLPESLLYDRFLYGGI